MRVIAYSFGKIHGPGFLVELGIMRLELHPQAAIRQRTVDGLEVLVHRTRKDQPVVRDLTLNHAEIRLQHDSDIAVRQHLLEHRRIAVERHRLIRVLEVPVVAADVHRDACGHRGIEFVRLQSPLLDGVAEEDVFVYVVGEELEILIVRFKQLQDRDLRPRKLKFLNSASSSRVRPVHAGNNSFSIELRLNGTGTLCPSTTASTWWKYGRQDVNADR